MEKLHAFGLGKPLGLEISGEGQPRIKSTTDKDFNSRSLFLGSLLVMNQSLLHCKCWPSTMPLQIMAGWYAQFHKRDSPSWETRKRIMPDILRDSIASQDAIRKIKTLLEGVVEHGTASSLNKSPYKIAGKTGTAQIANPKFGYDVNHRSYQASFVGYFPADKPKYSCIVVVYAPSNNFYYGGAVAAPIFKEIADKVFSNHFDLQKEQIEEDTSSFTMPLALVGIQKDVRKVLAKLDHPVESTNLDASWVSTSLRDDKVVLQERKILKGTVPNVIGMGARDAVYLLENSGLRVRMNGKGVVTSQSLNGGSRLMKGDLILIELS